ncbi:MAG: hypothetical protein K2P57_01490 [Burkholderiales bacterium]|nr:hypothetical protein [Burkholderiales bacterium]
MTPDNGAIPETHESDDVDLAVLERLLSMAQTYRSEGSVRQAMEMFWELVEDFSGTPQAQVARKALLDLAMSYERSGARREARSIYERLV